jgi:hydrogenase maturation protease
MGIGNVDYGDDGFGVRLAEKLIEAGTPDVVVGGTSPDRCLGRVVEEGFNHLVFLDAVECGGTPGSVVLLNTEEIVARFPQVSTHNISLGVQPESLKRAGSLTTRVQTTLDALGELLCSLETAATHCAAETES